MTIMELGALGEFVGAIAVVLTLAYLAIQIRDQNRESRTRIIQDLIRGWNEILGSYIDIAEVADIFRRGSVSYIKLDPKDQPRFAAILGRMSRIFEGLYLQKIEGGINDDLWAGIDNSIHDIYAQPGSQEWWQLRSHWYSIKFRAFVNLKIDEGRQVSLYPPENPG